MSLLNTGPPLTSYNKQTSGDENYTSNQLSLFGGGNKKKKHPDQLNLACMV